MNVQLRAAASHDRSFVEAVYYETQRWIIVKLFGWRGDEFEQAKFAEFYDEPNTQIITLDGKDIGWLTVVRAPDHIDLDSMHIATHAQRAGIGTSLIQHLIEESVKANVPLTLSTAKINPARALYERLGFVVVGETEFKVSMVREP